VKRLLKWGAFAALLLAVATVGARYILGRRSNGDDDDGGWGSPEPPEPPSPSTLAEEYISPVDEPIAPPSTPESATTGEDLVREVLGTPEPDIEPELVPSAGMETEAGVVPPDEVLAEDRNDGIPVPEEAVAEPMAPAPEIGDQEPITNSELTSGIEAEPAAVLPDEVLAEDRDEGMPVPEEAVAVPATTEQGVEHTELTSGIEAEPAAVLPDEVLAEDRDDGMPVPEATVAEPPAPAYEAVTAPEQAVEHPELTSGLEGEPAAVLPDQVLAEDRDEGMPVPEKAAAEPTDFLTQAFERLAATPETPVETPSQAPLVESHTGQDIGDRADEDEQPRQPAEDGTGSSTHTPADAADAIGEVSTQTWADLDELTTRPPEHFAPPADEGAGLESLEQALTDVSPERIQLAPSRNAESYLDEGNVYFNVGQYSLAIDRYTRALELDSGLIAAYYNRANARTRSGEFDSALADYNEALALQPDDADALNNRGMLHLYRTNYGEALRDFNAALAADPTDTTVMVNRGLAQLHGGQPGPALDDFRGAIAIDGNDAAAHYGAAQASVALGDRDGSLTHVERAIRLDPAYAREAAADPRLTLLQGDDRFMRLLRESGARSG
jgi:Tfp pilus assembly protein PilF